MGRPKRPLNGVETITQAEWAHMSDVYPGKLGVRQHRRWDAARHWRYRTANGVFDPLTYLLILDALANIDPDIELRSKNLAKWLNQHRDQFFWDAVTVGKVLMDIQEAFEDVLGRKNGLIEKGYDYKGNFWLIHHNSETSVVYYGLREDLMRLAELEIAARDLGQKTPRLVSPLLECPTLRVALDAAAAAI